MLNEYFTEMVKVIYAHHGDVDKFIGDAIMARWGAPKSTGDDAYHAVMASLEMRLALEQLNQKRALRGDIPIRIGMGVHFGETISGTIGSDDRMEYTVIGDTVNMASRIEASTKAFGTDLLLSEDIAKLVKDRFILEAAGSAEVKGKAEALKFFKVRGYIDGAGKKVIVKTPWSDYKAEAAEKINVVS
jgi:adenylate cyclase